MIASGMFLPFQTVMSQYLYTASRNLPYNGGSKKQGAY